MRHHRTAFVSLTLCATLLVGCGLGSDEPESPDPSQTETQADPKDQEGENEDLPVNALEVDPHDVVGEATYTLPGTDDEVKVGILPLEVKGDIMIMRLIFTPDFDSAGDDELIAMDEMYPDNSFKFLPTLVDYQNLKQYEMLSNTGQYWQPSTRSLETVNGEPVDWWGVYAARENDIGGFGRGHREDHARGPRAIVGARRRPPPAHPPTGSLYAWT